MVDLIMLQSVSYVAVAVSVAIAAVYYILTLRSNNKTRQSQTFMQLYQQLWNKEVLEDSIYLIDMEWEDLNDFWRKYDSSVDPKNYSKRWKLWSLMDATGLFMKKGLISKEIVYHLMGSFWGIWVWKKFEPVIKDERRRLNVPELFVNFEYLGNEMIKIREKRGQTTTIPETWAKIKPDK